MNYNTPSVLVVEDGQSKWEDLENLLKGISDLPLRIHRAANMEQATESLAKLKFDLVLLDISLDIRKSESGPKAGGHDTIGGLRVAERMYLLGEERPTIVVTAFDAFPSRNAKGDIIIGIDDVIGQARAKLGDNLRGWVRYGDPDWKDNLTKLIRGEFNK